MKKSLLLLAISALLCVGVTPTQAASDYSKCPDTWKLTSTNQTEFDKEIQDAKTVLGMNLAFSLVSREIFDGRTWRIFATQDWMNPSEATLLPLLRLPMRSTLKIEVKGCNAPLLHTITYGFGELKFIESSYQNFFQDVNKLLPQAEAFKFSDFKQEENAFSVLKKIVASNKSNLVSTKYSGGIFWYDDGTKKRVIYAKILKPILNGVSANGPQLILQMVPERLDCIALTSGITTNNEKPLKFDRNIWIPMGTNCKYQVVAWLFGNERYPHAVFILDSLTIETIKPNVYCQNLKNSANIFPVTKGKCPSGSKRVS